MMKYPEKIADNCIIGVTSPSDGLHNGRKLLRLKNAIKNFNNIGYRILETENTRKMDIVVSSSAKTRASEFVELWKNEDVKWIITTWGGEFLIEILEHIDKDIIRNCVPKWVQGMSDTNILLFYLTTNFNIATVHGENFGDFGREKIDTALLKTIEILKNPKDNIQNNYELYQLTDLAQEEGNELARI